MKRVIFGLLTGVVFLSTIMALSSPALAFNPFSADPGGTSRVCNHESDTNAAQISDSPVCDSSVNGDNPISGSNGILIKVTNLLALAGGIAAIIIIIVQGLRFILSNGTPDKVASARDGVIYAVVGLVVIILARTIIVFVINRL